MLKGRCRILLKRMNVHLKNVPDMVSTCLVLHNMCIIFGDTFWREKWIREAADEVHNGLDIPNVSGSTMSERMTVANLTLQNLAGIDDQSRETLEYIKQEDVRVFEISMSTAGKSFKELSARQSSMANNFWMAKTKAANLKLSLIIYNSYNMFSKFLS